MTEHFSVLIDIPGHQCTGGNPFGARARKSALGASCPLYRWVGKKTEMEKT